MKGRGARIGWFVAIWALSVLAIAGLAYGLRGLLQLVTSGAIPQ